MNICGLQKSSATHIHTLVFHSAATPTGSLGAKIEQVNAKELSTTMGFDLFIYLKLMMCPETGKPFYFGPNLEKVYTLPECTIPEDLRPYLQGRGHFFFAYIENLDTYASSETDVETFLEYYPSWEEVKQHSSFEEDISWGKKDHIKFKELLEFLAKQAGSYSVSWSW